ncbi:MAG: hypothetical protein AAGG07_06135 [Planctomycetota bacterium]
MAQTDAPTTAAPSGSFVQRDGRWLYEIDRVDAMDPFLMTIVGDTDLWLFLSSTGAFTGGRVEADRCLFPYETDDTLHESAGLSGPVTLIRLDGGRIWRPFDPRGDDDQVTRRLRRSLVGDLVELEETDERTGLTFCARYTLSDRHGIVRTCDLSLGEDEPGLGVELLDGYVNIMPAGVPLGLQQGMSTLVDGYKRSEFVAPTGPAVYVLESLISDRAAALESLRANAVWHAGLDGATISIRGDAVRRFERGERAQTEPLALGGRGAYLCSTTIALSPGSTETWHLVADTHLDHSAVASIRSSLTDRNALVADVERSLNEDAERLDRLLDEADGLQVSEDTGACAAHRSNVLFNAMRGGVPIDGYAVEAESFRRFVHDRNAIIGARHDSFLSGLSGGLTLDHLPELVAERGDPQLVRLALEYLPLTFGRRHGDPSRPWNRFRIQVRDDQGERIVGYEGNWRDIFQNWEALARSYPAILPGVIAKFVNASTLDGYNPYRINEHGIDWERPEPGHEFANIGYWGDHQIVYLLRLLEQCNDTYPDRLGNMLDTAAFSYSEVPYRLKSFHAIAADPRVSIDFDEDLDASITQRTSRLGGDGSLVSAGDEPVLVTLLEKLLVSALAKISSLVPDGGVWMNTQRPEWNDANNALAGFGLSMVTLNQLRKYCDFLASLMGEADAGTTPVSATVATWCREAGSAIADLLVRTANGQRLTASARWESVRALGLAAEKARVALYASGPGAAESVDRSEILAFLRNVREVCDRSIHGSRRESGLYESYNVMKLADGEAHVEPLYEMLEGQVAVLSSGVLGPQQACELLDALFKSSLYRDDQRTFMLYPNRDLPPFMERNAVDRQAVDASPLLTRALTDPSAALVSADASGTIRFHADINSHDALAERLRSLASEPDWAELVPKGMEAAHAAFEQTFAHASFTGRSGRMHKYEGLGSIYWHMVSKLLLAAQECVFEASDAGAPAELITQLRAHYSALRDGLGFRKTPSEFGAVPHEPYSHTPWARGAQQPGMTGQVKEGVLARLGELGVRLSGGTLRFDPAVFDDAELLEAPRPMLIRGEPDRTVEVPAGTVGLTCCHVPVLIGRGDRNQITVHTADEVVTVDGRTLPEAHSRELFARSGAVSLIEVRFTRDA